MDYNKRPYFYGTGRRKKSVARVRLYAGTGSVKINDRDIDEYFGLETLKLIVRQDVYKRQIATMGQAVGVAAGICKRYGVLPRAVYETHIQELQQTLLRDDQTIPGIKNCLLYTSPGGRISSSPSPTTTISSRPRSCCGAWWRCV